MDYEAYRREYFANPQPDPRFDFCGCTGVALFFEAFEAAVAYYQQVLGPPAYAEGDDTRGWRIGSHWLTLLRGTSGSPGNIEVILQMATPEETERLQRAFIEAGGEGEPPEEVLMYEPIRSCSVRDPFGTGILLICPLFSSQS